jgi:hypothetical protein
MHSFAESNSSTSLGGQGMLHGAEDVAGPWQR